MTNTRSERKAASAIECVTKMTVVFELQADPGDLQIHLLSRERIERPEGFIHQQQRWRENQSAGDRHPLLHAARQLMRVLLFESGQPHRLQQRSNASLALLAREPGDFAGQSDIRLARRAKGRAPGPERRCRN